MQAFAEGLSRRSRNRGRYLCVPAPTVLLHCLSLSRSSIVADVPSQSPLLASPSTLKNSSADPNDHLPRLRVLFRIFHPFVVCSARPLTFLSREATPSCNLRSFARNYAVTGSTGLALNHRRARSLNYSNGWGGRTKGAQTTWKLRNF